MQKAQIDHWVRSRCPEGEEELRLALILRLLYEADDRGTLPKLTVYRVRMWSGTGKVVAARLLGELEQIGFLRHGPRLTEIIPYRSCVRPMGFKERLAEREQDHGGDYFTGEREPDFGRPPREQASLQQGG